MSLLSLLKKQKQTIYTIIYESDPKLLNVSVYERNEWPCYKSFKVTILITLEVGARDSIFNSLSDISREMSFYFLLKSHVTRSSRLLHQSMDSKLHSNNMPLVSQSTI